MDTERRAPWFDYLLYSFKTAHEFSAARIRQKLVANTATEDLLSEADEMVRRDIGHYPSEEPHDPYSIPEADAELERSMREIAMHNFDSLVEVESYMWGLGISGLFHQWERDTRRAVVHFSMPVLETERASRLKFKELCEAVERTGFQITRHNSYPGLRLAYLISNTIKHGDGPASETLIAERGDLFTGGPIGVRMGNLPVLAMHLRVGQREYDEVTQALGNLWSGYEDTRIAILRKNI